MNVPKFTAEASLYQTGGHYRTGSQVIHSLPRAISPITPAITSAEVPVNVPGEIIEVHGEAPGCPLGWIKIGGTCVLEGPPSGGGSGTPGGGGEGGGPSGGAGTPFGDKPKDDPRDIYGCTSKQYESKKAKPCLDKGAKDPTHSTYLRCEGRKMKCCKDHGDEVTICDEL
jgi:hypothetical protein